MAKLLVKLVPHRREFSDCELVLRHILALVAAGEIPPPEACGMMSSVAAQTAPFEIIEFRRDAHTKPALGLILVGQKTAEFAQVSAEYERTGVEMEQEWLN